MRSRRKQFVDCSNVLDSKHSKTKASNALVFVRRLGSMLAWSMPECDAFTENSASYDLPFKWHWLFNVDCATMQVTRQTSLAILPIYFGIALTIILDNNNEILNCKFHDISRPFHPKYSEFPSSCPF